MKKLLYFIVLIAGFVSAAEKDTLIDRSLIVVPIGYYTPETSVALGFAGGYYFQSNDLSKISSISYSAIYTLKDQFIFHVSPKLYSKNKQYYFYNDFTISYYPDKFYGIRANDVVNGIDYTGRYLQLKLQPQRFINKWLSFGLNYLMRYESPLFSTQNNIINSSLYGFDPYFVQGIGTIVAIDSRDNYFYPNKGFFGKFTTWFSSKNVASDYDIIHFNLDVREYIPIYKKHIFAYQIYGDFISGNTPFQLMPTFGGSDKLRGFRDGMFVDNNVIFLQTEYRYPIYKRLKGVIFNSFAHHFDDTFFNDARIKFAYGAGLRYRLNDARVHLRFDYGFTNFGTQGFYITATEAF